MTDTRTPPGDSDVIGLGCGPGLRNSGAYCVARVGDLYPRYPVVDERDLGSEMTTSYKLGHAPSEFCTSSDVWNRQL